MLFSFVVSDERLEDFIKDLENLDNNDSELKVLERDEKEISFIFLTLLKFHFDISGIWIKELHPSKIFSIFCKLSVFQLELSGNFNHEEQ